MTISFLKTADKNILKFHTEYYLKTFDAKGRNKFLRPATLY